MSSNKPSNVLYKIYRNEGIYSNLQIKVLPILAHFYHNNTEDLTFETSRMPMITTPLPWSSVDIGGYFLTSSNLLRIDVKSKFEQYDFIKKSKPNEMYPIYDALNSLSSCPWKINVKVSFRKVFVKEVSKLKFFCSLKILDLLIDVFNNNGGENLGIPLHNSKLQPIPRISKNVAKSEFITSIKKRDEIQKVHAENFSLWCTELYRLSIANKVLGS